MIQGWGGSCRGGVGWVMQGVWWGGVSMPKKMQPQNKGPGMLWEWSYITPMTSCDVIGMIGGGVCHRGGVCHGKLTSLEI